MEIAKPPGPSDVSLELVSASREAGIYVMVRLCQRFLHEVKTPTEWALSIVVQVFRRNGDARNCSCYGAVKRLEHGMKDVRKNGFIELCLLMKCNLVLCLQREQWMLYLS